MNALIGLVVIVGIFCLVGNFFGIAGILVFGFICLM
jgi:hypothetical protein